MKDKKRVWKNFSSPKNHKSTLGPRDQYVSYIRRMWADINIPKSYQAQSSGAEIFPHFCGSEANLLESEGSLRALVEAQDEWQEIQAK